MGFDFTVFVPILPSHCGFSFVFGCGVSFFGEFQCLPVSDCSAVSCDSGVLARGSKSTSFYSAILNQFLESFLMFHIYPTEILVTISLILKINYEKIDVFTVFGLLVYEYDMIPHLLVSSYVYEGVQLVFYIISEHFMVLWFTCSCFLFLMVFQMQSFSLYFLAGYCSYKRKLLT